MKVNAILSLGLMAALSASVRAWDFTDELDRSGDATTTSTSASDDDANDEQRIYGGTEADASLYKYIVSLRKTADGATYCGGSLIAPQYVLTAAHCVKTTAMYASIGSKFSTGVSQGERIAVAQAYVHPKYNKADHLFDLAVLKLSAPSTQTPVPLCNADGSDNKEQTMAVVRGWGMTETKVPASTLQEVNVRIITNAECNKQYNNRITDGMLCAGEGGGKDSCQGDSGGPLVSNNKLIGLVSWGGACGNAAGVYVRLTTVLDWISEKVGGAAASNSSTSSGAAASNSSTSSSSTGNATMVTVAPTPVPATSVPPVTEATTTAPVTTAPAATTATPVATTATPVATTVTPVATTVTPVATTAAPVATTVTPVATTVTPVATTAAPVATIATPVATTVAPVATTATPVATTSAPAAAVTTSPAIVATLAPATNPSMGKQLPGKKTNCMINKKPATAATASKSAATAPATATKSNEDMKQSYSEYKELSDSEETEETGNEYDADEHEEDEETTYSE